MTHHPIQATQAPTRIQQNVLARAERRVLNWLCARLPAWVTPDQLTILGFLGVSAARRKRVKPALRNTSASRPSPSFEPSTMRPPDRTRAGSGRRVAVRVDRGGRRIIKKKKN